MTISKQKNWLLYVFVGILLLGGLFCNTIHADAKEVKSSPQLKATSSVISGKVFDGQNQGVSGIKIELHDINGTLIKTTSSAADGTYQFASLAAGDYYCEIADSNYDIWWGSYGSDKKTGYFHIDGSNSVNNVDACIRYAAQKAGGIAGKVVDDNNGTPVAGVQITLYDSSGKKIQTTSSLADGTYSFLNLQNGSYYLEFTTPSGYTFHFQPNKTHFGQDGRSDYIYVDGVHIVNEGQPEGPSYGTIIHLLGPQEPPTPQTTPCAVKAVINGNPEIIPPTQRTWSVPADNVTANFYMIAVRANNTNVTISSQYTLENSNPSLVTFSQNGSNGAWGSYNYTGKTGTTHLILRDKSTGGIAWECDLIITPS